MTPPCWQCGVPLERAQRRAMVTVIIRGAMTRTLFVHVGDCLDRFRRWTPWVVLSVLDYQIGAAPHVALWRADERQEGHREHA